MNENWNWQLGESNSGEHCFASRNGISSYTRIYFNGLHYGLQGRDITWFNSSYSALVNVGDVNRNLIEILYKCACLCLQYDNATTSIQYERKDSNYDSEFLGPQFAGIVNNSKWRNPFANITWADTRASKSLYGNSQDPRKFHEFHALCWGAKIALDPGLNSLEFNQHYEVS